MYRYMLIVNSTEYSLFVSMPCVLFCVLTVFVGWQERHPACKKPAPFTSSHPRGYVLEQVEKANQGPTS